LQRGAKSIARGDKQGRKNWAAHGGTEQCGKVCWGTRGKLTARHAGKEYIMKKDAECQVRRKVLDAETQTNPLLIALLLNPSIF